MNLEKVVFWTRQIGWPPSYKSFPENLGIELLLYALERWISSFDTAPIYGNGRSEEILWKAIGKSNTPRPSINIITKFGMIWDKSWHTHFDFSKQGLEEQLQASLNRLKTDYIDIYLLHIPSENSINVNEVINTLNLFQEKWLIKSYWLCNTYDKLLLDFLNHPQSHIEYIQDFYNILEKKAEKLIFPYLDWQKFMAYSPLYRGLLTDTPVWDLFKKDEAGINRLLKHNYIKELLQERNIYTQVSKNKNIPLQKIAIDFLKNNPKVDKILFWTTSKKHLDTFLKIFLETSQSFSDK